MPNNISSLHLSLCKYYHGESEMPAEYKNDVRGDFWHGEMMFCTNEIDIDQLKEIGQEIMKGLEGEKREFAERMSPEQFGMIIYIEELFARWRPWDSLDWILEW